MFLVWRRLYDAITSLVCFSRVLVPLISCSKRRVRKTFRLASETELSSGELFSCLLWTASYALKLALKSGM